MPFPDPPAVSYNNNAAPPPPGSGPGTFPTPPHGSPPPFFRGSFATGNEGELSFSCEFELSGQFARTQPTGIISTLTGEVYTGNGGGGDLSIATGLGINLNVGMDAFGGCRASISGTVAELDSSEFLVSPRPNGGFNGLLFDSGNCYVILEEPDGGLGHWWVDDHIDKGPCAACGNAVKGTFSCFIRAAEYKDVEQALVNSAGPGEPPGQMAYIGYSFPLWVWGYSFSIDSPYPQSEFSLPSLPMSGTFGVGERWLYDNHGNLSGVTYDGLGGTADPTDQPGARFVQPECTAKIGCGGGYSDEGNWGQGSCSKIMFSSGVWYPLSYEGRENYSPRAFVAPDNHISVGPGHISGYKNGLIVQAASSTSAHLFGRLYRGDDLYPGTVRASFGNDQSLLPGYGPPIQNVQFVDIVDGILDVYIPQIQSVYYGDTHDIYDPSYLFTYTPPLPAPRNDYNYNSFGLILPLVCDQLVKFLDDYSWPATTFHHAKSVKVENFSDISRWTGHNGTLSGPGLTMNATADHFIAASPTAFSLANPNATPPSKDWDCKNYRYWQMTVTSSAAGPGLKLSIGDKVFTTPALTAGAQTVIIDLCRPDGYAGYDLTHTGWDTQPGFRYGVNAVDTLFIEGVPNGHTVTIADITLMRKDDACPGYVAPETTHTSQAEEVPWYAPDVPYQDGDCTGLPNPDEILTELNQVLYSHNHLYARLLRDYADGKPAADIPHAIGSWPFLDANMQPKNYVDDPDRLMLTDFVALVNKQTGLSCTPAQDGIYAPSGASGTGKPNSYDAKNVAAIWLNRDNYTVAEGQKKTTLVPSLTDANLDGAALTCRLQFDFIKNYPGQFRALEYAFLKRTDGVFTALVVMPDGSSPLGQVVTLTPCVDRLHEGVVTATADKNGYVRFPHVTPDASTLTAGGYIGPVVQPHSRATVWVGLSGLVATGLFTPSNLEDRDGRYHRILSVNGNLTYWRSDFALPVLTNWRIAGLQITTSGKDAFAHLAYDARRLLWVVFQRKGGTDTAPTYDGYRMVSYDDGATWSDPQMAIGGAKYIDCRSTPDGGYIEWGVVLNANQTANPGGVIKAQFRGYGDSALSGVYTLQDHTGANLAVADDTVSIDQGKAGSALWLLTVHIQGDPVPSDWYSSDLNAQTWTRIPDGS